MTDLQTAATVEKGHGRLETRCLTVSRLLAEASDWPHLAQVFRLERTVRRIKTGESYRGLVHGVTSLFAAEASPARRPQIVREQWGIDNKLHWRRDALFHEDRTRIKSPTLGHALAAANNWVIGLACRLGWTNLAEAQRFFDAHPIEALKALISRLA